MTKHKRELTPRYKVPEPENSRTIPSNCKKHYVDKMVGEKGSVLVMGTCKKCNATVYQDRVSWLEEKKKRGL